MSDYGGRVGSNVCAVDAGTQADQLTSAEPVRDGRSWRIRTEKDARIYDSLRLPRRNM